MDQQVDFYILSHHEPVALAEFVVRLCQKVYQTEKILDIFTQSVEQAQNLDQQLWVERAESFIPHTLCEDNQRHISVGKGNVAQIIVNLELSEPEGAWRRMLYVVTNEDESLVKARDLYKYFKQQAIRINTHKMT